MNRPLTTVPRIVAGVLGVIWMAAGLAAIALGVRGHQWGTVALGLAAVYFGGIWWHVARTGRYVAWPFRSRDP
jgi:hypothetical protein